MALVERAASVIRGLDVLAPISDLLLRVWVAWQFYKSALTKGYWDASFPFFHVSDSTFMLFEYEYAVPLIPTNLAAYMGTYVELIFPVLLAFGLFGRLAAFVIFVFNIIAVVSYPDLGTAGKLQHLVWGIMLLVPLLHGPGKLSIDHLFRRKYMPLQPATH